MTTPLQPAMPERPPPRSSRRWRRPSAGTLAKEAVLLAAIVMFNTMLMNMSERDRELATLRVLGASSSRLGVMLLLEAIGIGLVSGIVGVLFAFGGALGLATAFSTWQFYFPVVIDPGVAVELVVAVVGLALLTTPVGIWRLRRLDLVEKVKEFGGV